MRGHAVCKGLRAVDDDHVFCAVIDQLDRTIDNQLTVDQHPLIPTAPAHGEVPSTPAVAITDVIGAEIMRKTWRQPQDVTPTLQSEQ